MTIDNAVIEVGPDLDIPVVDKVSSRAYCDIIQSAGVTVQDDCRRYIIIDTEIRIESGDSYVVISPATRGALSVSATINFPIPISNQNYLYVHHGSPGYINQISSARSFIRSNLSYRWRDGSTTRENISRDFPLVNIKAHNGCLLTFDNEQWTDPLDDQQEPVKHKIQDMIGDLALLGTPLIADINAYKPGHALNIDLCRRIREIYE